jgi:serine/threonine protein kinase
MGCFYGMWKPSTIDNRIDHYVLEDELGRGGMGVVFRAFDTSLDRPVALKFPLPKYVELREMRERFMIEARSAARLRHIHIVTVHTVGQTDECPYIVMEFVEGQSLHDYIKSAGRLSPAKALSIIRQVADGLAAAHSRDIIHLDIKPQNIMLDECDFVRLMDFGQAHVLSGQLHLDRGGGFAGTPAYASPEQAVGGRIDYRADIYALGVVLYQMLTGALPFQAETTRELLQKITMDPFPDIRNEIPEFPAGIIEMLNKMTAKDPSDRYASAREIEKAATDWLRDTCDTPTVPAQGKLASEESPSPSWTARLWVRIAAALFIAVLLGLYAGRDRFIPTEQSTSTRVPATANNSHQFTFVMPYLGPAERKTGYDVFRALRESLDRAFEGVGSVNVRPEHLSLKDFEDVYNRYSRDGLDGLMADRKIGQPGTLLLIENRFNSVPVELSEGEKLLHKIIVNPKVLDEASQTLRPVPGWSDVKLRLVKDRLLEGFDSDVQWMGLLAAHELIRFLKREDVLILTEPEYARVRHNLLAELSSELAVRPGATELFAMIEDMLVAEADSTGVSDAELTQAFNTSLTVFREAQVSGSMLSDSMDRQVTTRRAPYQRL